MGGVVLSATARLDGGRSRVLGVALVGAGAALVLLLTLRPPLGGGVMPLAIGCALVVPTWLATTSNHKAALAFILLYLGLLDGYLKLKAPAGNELPGLGRDLLLYAVAIGMVVRAIVQKRQLTAPPLTGWVVAFVLVVVVQLLNPAGWSLLHSAASLRQHLEFVPLFFIGYALMRDQQSLRRFMLLMLVVAAANGAVGAMQFNMSPEQLSSWGPGYAALIEGKGVAPRTAEAEDGGKRVRPPALGSDMGFGGTTGGIALPLALALLAMGGMSARRKLLVVAPLGAGAVVAVATSQSRGAVIAAVVAVIAFSGLGVAARRALPIISTLLVVGVIGAVAVSLSQSGGDGTSFNRYESIAPTKALDTTVASRESTFALIPEYANKYPLGAGLGSVGPAAGVIDPPPDRRLNAESQFTFMIIELGIIGLLVLTAFQIKLTATVARNLRKLAGDDTRLLLAGIAAPLFMFFALWIVGANTTSSPNAPYLWFSAGVLMYWLHPRSSRVREGAAKGPVRP